MAANSSPVVFDELVDEANAAPLPRKLWLWTRMSGPGWLQGAVTLGGGSLAGSLYLGVIMGYGLMWLQPLAMMLGVIMLAAISYVALSTGERPFALIRTHVSPALAWAWLFATMMANIVWSLPQYALGTAALTQNLVPSLDSDTGRMAAAGGLLGVSLIVVWFYNSGSRGIKLFEYVLKGLVGLVVISFFGVVAAMTRAGLLPWGEIVAGLVPNLNALFEPAASLRPDIAATGDFADWWSAKIAGMQKDNIITAFATAVGINMTFLLPYSMLRKGWGKRHRGIGIFDLSIGLIVPFVLATSCVVIAAASQFHGNPDDVLRMVEIGKGKEVAEYNRLVDDRLKQELGSGFGVVADDDERIADARKSLPLGDRRLAAMIAGRDNLALAKTLEPLVGKTVSQKLFGVGVLGMAVSTIIILMVINGFAFCEMIGADSAGPMHRLGALIPAVGVLGPFYWASAAPALATPTSVIGGAMLPIAYVTFLLLMNSPKALGDSMPRGFARFRWNLMMIPATTVAGFGSVWGMYGKTLGWFPIGNVGIVSLVVLLVVGVASFVRKNRASV
jgi:Mn2+/Fe2+ NRAMP family transporter